MEEEKPERRRAQVACAFCRKRKSRCDGGAPCSKCRKSNQPCIYRPVTAEENQVARERKLVSAANNPFVQLAKTPRTRSRRSRGQQPEHDIKFSEHHESKPSLSSDKKAPLSSNNVKGKGKNGEIQFEVVKMEPPISPVLPPSPFRSTASSPGPGDLQSVPILAAPILSPSLSHNSPLPLANSPQLSTYHNEGISDWEDALLTPETPASLPLPLTQENLCSINSWPQPPSYFQDPHFSVASRYGLSFQAMQPPIEPISTELFNYGLPMPNSDHFYHSSVVRHSEPYYRHLDASYWSSAARGY